MLFHSVQSPAPPLFFAGKEGGRLTLHSNFQKRGGAGGLIQFNKKCQGMKYTKHNRHIGLSLLRE